ARSPAAPRPACRSGARAWARGERRSDRRAAAASTWSSFRPRFLQREQRLVDGVREAEAALGDEALGVLLGQERAPWADAGRVAERTVALKAGIHLLEHRVDELDLEVLRLRAQACGARRLQARVGGGAGRDGAEVEPGEGRELRRRRHHI